MNPRSRNVAAAALAACLRLALPGAAGAEGFPLSLAGSTTAACSAWEDRGSALVPAGMAAAYAGSAAAEFRAEAPAGGESLSRCAFEGLLSIDTVTGAASFTARELWAEWRPVPAISLRAGRQRLGFGSGFAWNPSNDLDAKRDASDPSAPRAGADAALLRLDASDLAGFPLSLSAEGLLPGLAAGTSLTDAKLGLQLYALLGELELMAVASAASLGGEKESWLAGGWATAQLGPLVLGLEAALRARDDLWRLDGSGARVADRKAYASAAATATLRSGDFIVVAEGYWDEAAYSRDELDRILGALSSMGAAERTAWAAALLPAGSVGALHALGRVTWSSGDWSASAGAVADCQSGAFVASLEAQAAVQGIACVKAKAAIPGPAALLEDDELGLSGRGPSLQASICVSF